MRTTINLLPAASRKQFMLRRRLMQWCAVLCGVLVMMWVARWYKLQEYYALGQQQEVLEREHRPLQTMVKEIAKMRQQLEVLSQQETIAKELDHYRRALSLLGAVSQAAQQSKGRFRVTNFQLVDLQRSSTGGSQQTTGPQPGSFTLSGVSLDSPAVAELLDRLQQSGLFTSVELVSLKEKEEGGVSLHDFQVACTL